LVNCTSLRAPSNSNQHEKLIDIETPIKYYNNETNRIKHSCELEGNPPAASGGSCVFGTVGAECALVVKGVTNYTPAGTDPFAPGGVWYTSYFCTLNTPCVCSNYLHLCGRAMFASKQLIFCTQNTMEGFFFFNIKLFWNLFTKHQ